MLACPCTRDVAVGPRYRRGAGRRYRRLGGGVCAVYYKPSNQPQLILRRRTDTDDHELVARAWQAANEKARELGWIA